MDIRTLILGIAIGMWITATVMRVLIFITERRR